VKDFGFFSMFKRRYFLICFDGSLITLDDFSSNQTIISIGKSRSRLGLNPFDWFILFDKNKDAITGHGQVLNTVSRLQQLDQSIFLLEFMGAVTNKRSEPLRLQAPGLEFLNKPWKKTLVGWKERCITKLTEKEFNTVFHTWWGVESFSKDLRMA
jgi:hypothetical protein